MLSHYAIEKSLWENGFNLIAGCDEAGRGALAGPICGAAVIFDKSILENRRANLIKDSKKISAKKRLEAYNFIIKEALCYASVFVENEVIDIRGITYANTLAIVKSVEKLHSKPQKVITDFFHIHKDFKNKFTHTQYQKGESVSLSIAAASIIAKVTRDAFMKEKAHIRFPGYGFDKHVGYGTKEHIENILLYGRCSLHRKSFKIKSR